MWWRRRWSRQSDLYSWRWHARCRSGLAGLFLLFRSLHSCLLLLSGAAEFKSVSYVANPTLPKMTQIWTPRLRCALSILLYGVFCLQSYWHHDSVRLPYPLFFIGMSALCFLFLYLLEHADGRMEELVGNVGLYFFLVLAAMGVLMYLFGWQHVRVQA